MQEEPNKVQKLNETLYSRTAYRAPEDARHIIQPTEVAETNEDWQSPNIDDMIQQERRRRPNHPIMKRIFIFALIFCLGAVAIAGVIYLGGGNLVSSKNVDISVQAPVSISAGDTVDMGIQITNKNNADLTMTSLSIEYPSGTKDAADPTKSLSYVKIAIGDLAAGKSITKHSAALFFGQQGEVKEVRINVDYQIKGSVATFSKQKVYEVAIGTSPLGIEVQDPTTVTSGDAFTTTLTIKSNALDVLKNVVVRAEYPYGYSLSSSVPTAASKDLNSWVLGDMTPGDTKTITLKGSLVGEDADERTFRFYTGVGNEAGGLDTTLSLTSATVALNRPAISLAVNFNGETTNPYIAPAGSLVRTSIKLQNNLPQSLSNTRVTAKLSGASLDKFSIAPENGGFYNSSSNTIVWDTTNAADILNTAPGGSVALNFTFVSQNDINLNAKNPEIGVDVSLSAIPQGGTSADTVTLNTQNSVRLASKVSLSSKSLYSRGPFVNVGPLPPKADKETTYTIVLDLGNTQNEIVNGKVTGTLGPNVTWLRSASTSETVSYDEKTNTVTWFVGTLAAGTGFSAPGREGVFRVSLTPSIGQVGSAPVLFANPVFSGTDSFTQKTMSVSNPSITTRITSDPKFVQGNELVVK